MGTQRRIRDAGYVTVALAAALAAAVLVLWATPALSAEDEPGVRAASKALGTNGAAAPKVAWKACPEDVLPPGTENLGYECATVKVPLWLRLQGECAQVGSFGWTLH